MSFTRQRSLQRRGIALVLANVNEQPLPLIKCSGFEAIIGDARLVRNLDEVAAATR